MGRIVYDKKKHLGTKSNPKLTFAIKFNHQGNALIMDEFFGQM